MTNINMIQLTQHERINPTILACNMMTLYAPLILLGLPRNHHMHYLPTSDITRSSQDQIKLGINNTVVIIKWPQGAWSSPTILAQHHEYPTTQSPRYHGDHSRITNGTTLGSMGYLVTKGWSFTDHKRNHSWFIGLPRNQTVIIHGSQTEPLWVQQVTS